VAPGDVAGMAAAIGAMLERVRADPAGVSARARAEAERLFSPELVCNEICAALAGLVAGAAAAADVETGAARPTAT
jgi:hypothetical protein